MPTSNRKDSSLWIGMLNNKNWKNNNIVIMNFAWAYLKPEFYQDLGAAMYWRREIYGPRVGPLLDIDMKTYQGEESAMGLEFGIHFLDSEITTVVWQMWLDKIEEKFVSGVDYHTTCRCCPCLGISLILRRLILYVGFVSLDINTRVWNWFLSAGPPPWSRKHDGVGSWNQWRGASKTPGYIAPFIIDSNCPL